MTTMTSSICETVTASTISGRSSAFVRGRKTTSSSDGPVA